MLSPDNKEGRTGAWVRLKLDPQQEFVIGRYRRGNLGMDMLLVGYYDGRKLRFAGKVRAGLIPRTRREVGALLRSLVALKCPFVNLPMSKSPRCGAGVTAAEMAEMQWVKPKLVARIRLVEWTDDHHLRHAAFLGMGDDEEASKVGKR